jgi:hypothetical protein
MAKTEMQNYGIQIGIALAFFIVGLIFLLVWAILYSNRIANGLEAEWWVWIFLGFGLGFILIGIIWLIIIQYLIASKARELYEKVHFYEMKEEGMTVKTEETVRSPYTRTEVNKTEFVRPDLGRGELGRMETGRTYTRTYS